MSEKTELIKKENNGSLSFGNHILAEKTKFNDFEFRGDLYNVKSYRDITRLEKNGLFVYESVPGTTVKNFKADEYGMSFVVEGDKDAEITLGLEESAMYDVEIGGGKKSQMSSNRSGKLTLGIELSKDAGLSVTVRKF